MATYDYKAGRRRIQKILNIGNTVANALESHKDMSNAVETQITVVYVNMRNYSDLFHDDDKWKTSKIVRCFTSEIINILSDSGDRHLTKQTGIHKGCVYAIYESPHPLDIQEIVNRTFHANTYIKMLNKLLIRNGIVDNLVIGVGMDTGIELVIKGGQKGTGIKHPVWTGDTLTKALDLSTLGAKNNIHPIVASSSTYELLSEVQKRYFLHNAMDKYDNIYHSKAVLGGVNAWLNRGMPE